MTSLSVMLEAKSGFVESFVRKEQKNFVFVSDVIVTRHSLWFVRDVRVSFLFVDPSLT